MENNTNQTQKLITYIPLINGYITNGASYTEIANILEKQFQFKLDTKNPANYISSVISKNKKNLLNKEFEKFKILKIEPSDRKKYSDFCAESEYDFHITFSTTEIKNEYIINENNIHTIHDIRGCILAKRILRLHHIPDSLIENNHRLYYNIEKYENEDKNFINSIHDKIIPIFNKLYKELRLKPFFYKDLI